MGRYRSFTDTHILSAFIVLTIVLHGGLSGIVPAAAQDADSLTSVTTQYTYDGQGRLTQVEYTTSKGLGYQYDAAGNITAVQPVAVLPVELTTFESVVDGGDVLLTWATASETNNAGFEVQRRAKSASKWGKVAFIEGAGTTSTPQSYQHRVCGVAGGVHLFRLKQIDVDGKVEFSPVVEVDLGTPDRFALGGAYPNPSAGSVTIPYDVARKADVRLAIYDVLGRRVAVLVDEERPPGRYRVRMNTARLTTGVYFYRIQMSDFQGVKRLVVVR